jgi:predicted nucleic acid-binding protein
MTYILDTNIAIHLRDGDEEIAERVAAQALVHRATLVTLNPRDFEDVPDLSILAWTLQRNTKA